MDRLEFELDAARKRFDAEDAGRDNVRSSTAIPLAALSFAAFGFGAVAQNADVLARQLTTAGVGRVEFWLAATALSVASVALLCFLWAIVIFQRFDYIGKAPDPHYLDVEAQFVSMTYALIEGGMYRSDAEDVASVSAWRSALKSFEDAAQAQREANRKRCPAVTFRDVSANARASLS
ncbi:hypothetical protein [Salipiger mucosus]|uniref:hypothetical protein n=1 Tax=Salipiger mucosus TaxID=263378 RepID=UPI0012EC0D30|nr:hypothetical protein [Salipiger mucosus]